MLNRYTCSIYISYLILQQVVLRTVGVYGSQTATRYCITVKNIVASGELFKDSRLVYISSV